MWATLSRHNDIQTPKKLPSVRVPLLYSLRLKLLYEALLATRTPKARQGSFLKKKLPSCLKRFWILHQGEIKLSPKKLENGIAAKRCVVATWLWSTFWKPLGRPFRQKNRFENRPTGSPENAEKPFFRRCKIEVFRHFPANRLTEVNENRLASSPGPAGSKSTSSQKTWSYSAELRFAKVRPFCKFLTFFPFSDTVATHLRLFCKSLMFLRFTTSKPQKNFRHSACRSRPTLLYSYALIIGYNLQAEPLTG